MNPICAIRSAHPCWEGKPSLILPHMGYVLFDGRVMSYFHLYDLLHEDAGAVRISRMTLTMQLYRAIAIGGSEWWFKEHVYDTPTTRLFGFTTLRLDTECMWFVSTGRYNPQNLPEHELPFPTATFTHLFRDFTVHVMRFVQCVQRHFRRRRNARRLSDRLHTFAILREFLKHTSFPDDIANTIRDAVLQCTDSAAAPPHYLTLETALFRARKKKEKENGSARPSGTPS